jgi:hypothetical protein
MMTLTPKLFAWVESRLALIAFTRNPYEQPPVAPSVAADIIKQEHDAALALLSEIAALTPGAGRRRSGDVKSRRQ